MFKSALLIFSCLPVLSYGLIEINAGGVTYDAKQYLMDVTMPTQEEVINMVKQDEHKLRQQTLDINEVVGTQDSGLSFGKVEKHKVSSYGKFSFFVIGTDDKSISWAKENKEYIKSINAFGTIAHKATKDDMDRLSKIIDLPLIVMSLQGVSKELSITHYPFLVHDGWVTQ